MRGGKRAHFVRSHKKAGRILLGFSLPVGLICKTEPGFPIFLSVSWSCEDNSIPQIQKIFDFGEWNGKKKKPRA
jgi:hypothetical protein